MEMEGMFYSLQAELEAVNLAVTSQQEDIIALEDEKAFYKDRMKSLKKSRRKSIKTNSLNDAAEQSVAAELSQYSEQIDLIRDRIMMYSKENARLNDRAVEVQTELHDLDIRLEFSATDFFNKYGMDINDEALRSSAQQQVLLNPFPTGAAVDPVIKSSSSSSRFSNSASKIAEGGPMPKPSAVSDDDMSKISSLGFDEDGTSSVSKKKRSSKNKKQRSEDAGRSRPSVVQELLVNSDQLVVLREEEASKARGTTLEQSVDSPVAPVQRSVDVTAPLPNEDDAVSESGSLLLSSKKSKKKKKDRSKSSRPSVVQELLGDSSVEEQVPPIERQLFISGDTAAAATVSAEEAQYKDVTLDRFPFTASQEQQQQQHSSATAGVHTPDNVAVKSKSRERDTSDGKELPVEAALPTSGQGRRGNMVNNVGVVAVKTPNRNLRDIKLPVKNRYDVSSKQDAPTTKEVPPVTTRPSTADNMILQSPMGGPEAAVSSNRSTVLTPIATGNAIARGTTITATPMDLLDNTTTAPPLMMEKEESHHLDDDNYDELRKEYASVKDSLSRWKQDFVATYQREPTTDDFVNIDVSVQMLILRKDELNQLISQSKSRRRKSTIGGSREKEKSPKRTTKSRSGSIASESVIPASITSESIAMERSPGLAVHHPSDETLLAEYEDVKQRLALWRQTFVETNNREPTTNDFVTLDADTQIMILRRDELKQLVSGIKEKKRGASKSKPTAIGGLDAITEAAGDADQSQREQPLLSNDTTAATAATQSSPPKHSTFSNGGDIVRGNQSSTSTTEDRNVDLSAVVSASSSPVKALKRVVEVSEIYNKVDLLSELSSIKKVLSQWRRDFMANNAGREPSPADFLLMSPELQSLMLRREEIKAILNAEGEKRVTIVNQDSIYSDGSSRPLDFNPDRMTDKNKSKDNKKKTTHMDTTDLSSLASEVSDITADDDFKYKRDSMEATVVEAPSPLEISSAQSSAVKKQMKKGKKAKKKGGEDGGDGSTLASSITKSTAMADNDDPLRKEYQEVKKYLKRWKADFVREHGREPDNRDLESVGEETQHFIVRQFELKEAIDERDRKAAQDELLKKSIKSALHTYHE
jgi:hypothetical protein